MIIGTDAEYQSDVGSTKDNLYLALMGELWGVFCEYLWENGLRYNGTELYLPHWTMGCRLWIQNPTSIMRPNCVRFHITFFLLQSFPVFWLDHSGHFNKGYWPKINWTSIEFQWLFSVNLGYISSKNKKIKKWTATGQRQGHAPSNPLYVYIYFITQFIHHLFSCIYCCISVSTSFFIFMPHVHAYCSVVLSVFCYSWHDNISPIVPSGPCSAW